ncbi:MAG TPA: ABC transporter substrate-binding protein [Candidatus Nanopelagicales bacterium]|nr:ABC transporter substrate-binding protein [Candidatus Nanopelagicales bacterium]
MRRVGLAAALATVALATAGCGMGGSSGQESASSSAGSGNGHVVFDTSIPPKAAWAPESDDAHALMRAGCLETLLQYDYDSKLKPMLATEWKQTSPTTWEFTLRDGVKFQNGDPFNADAVVGALDHLLKAATPARAFNPKRIAGVKAIDPTHVEITTKAEDPLVPLRVASPNTGILSPKAFAGAQVDIKGTCTGPFTVTGEAPRQSLSLTRNDSYWAGKPKLKSAEVRYIVEGQTRATQLQTGEAQIVHSVPATSVKTIEGSKDVEIDTLQVARTTVMLLNNSRAPFDNLQVRQAIQETLDTKAIVAAIYEGSGTPAVGPFAPDTPWAPSDAKAITPDVEKAKQLLQQAGVGPLTIELIAYNDRPEFADLAAVIQAQLQKIGITVKIRTGEYASVEPDMLAGNFDAALLSRGYLVDVADPAGYLLSDFSCEGGYNLAHYCNADIDELISETTKLPEIDARNKGYQEIAQKLEEQAPGVFLVHEGAIWGHRSNVKNFKLHPLEYYVLTKDLDVG